MKNKQKSFSRCPKCGKIIIEPYGNPGSPYLLVGEYPSHKENIQGVPFAFAPRPTQTWAGDILKAELGRVGLTLNQILVTNLWYHQQDEKTCDHSLHVDATAKLFADRTHVLLMGSAATLPFVGVKYNEVSGIRVTVPGFSKQHFWASPNPALAYNQPIGELRLALERFAGDVRKTK